MASSHLEILAYDTTPLGVLCLRRRQLLHEPGVTVTEITLNQEFLMSSHYTFSERLLASMAIEVHGGHNLDVLIGGLGLGYTAYEALCSSRIKSVEVVEFLPQVISWLDRGLIPLAGELQSDKRLSIVEGDIYNRLLGSVQKKFDAILIDVDHSPKERLDSQSRSFYTLEALKRVQEHLSEGGVLAVWSYAEDSPFADALREVFQDVKVEKVSFEIKHLDNQRATDCLFFARK